MNKFNTEERMEDITTYNVTDGNDAYMDYRKFHYKNTVPDSRVLVFLTGFCVGMVFFYLFSGKDMGSGARWTGNTCRSYRALRSTSPGFLSM